MTSVSLGMLSYVIVSGHCLQSKLFFPVAITVGCRSMRPIRCYSRCLVLRKWFFNTYILESLLVEEQPSVALPNGLQKCPVTETKKLLGKNMERNGCWLNPWQSLSFFLKYYEFAFVYGRRAREQVPWFFRDASSI